MRTDVWKHVRTDMTKLIDSLREYTHPPKQVGGGGGMRKEKRGTLDIDCIMYCNNRLRSPGPVSQLAG